MERGAFTAVGSKPLKHAKAAARKDPTAAVIEPTRDENKHTATRT